MHIFLKEVLERALMGKTLIFFCAYEKEVFRREWGGEREREGGRRGKNTGGEDGGKGRGDWIKGRRGEALASLMEVFLPH